MPISTSSITALIRRRRAIFPKTYIEKSIPMELIEEVLENANWAPTHRQTEPWRFKVMTGDALERLGDYLVDYYHRHTPVDEFSAVKIQKMKDNPRRSGCVIAVCMQRDPEERVPEWEEIAAVACAVQNMWLTCTAYGIGSYWSTPSAMLNASEFLSLQEGERCLGLFYMGYHELPEMPGKRSPVSAKVVWM